MKGKRWWEKGGQSLSLHVDEGKQMNCVSRTTAAPLRSADGLPRLAVRQVLILIKPCLHSPARPAQHQEAAHTLCAPAGFSPWEFGWVWHCGMDSEQGVCAGKRLQLEHSWYLRWKITWQREQGEESWQDGNPQPWARFLSCHGSLSCLQQLPRGVFLGFCGGDDPEVSESLIFPSPTTGRRS